VWDVPSDLAWTPRRSGVVQLCRRFRIGTGARVARYFNSGTGGTAMNDKRRHERIAFPSEVTLTDPDFGAITTHTRDVSDGGVFLFIDQAHSLQVGVRVTLQVRDMSGEAPIVRAKVVRVEDDGVALMYEQD
jgi:hypothetical protein